MTRSIFKQSSKPIKNKRHNVKHVSKKKQLPAKNTPKKVKRLLDNKPIETETQSNSRTNESQNFPRLIKPQINLEKDEISSILNPLKQRCYVRYSDLEIGTTVMGVISNITSTKIQLDLPSHLFAFVDAEYATESETKLETKEILDLYSVGQCVQAVIISLENGAVSASLRPSIINKALTLFELTQYMWIPCMITSVEDLGWTGYIGIENIKVYVKQDQAKPKTLKIGQIISVTIEELNLLAKSVICSLYPSKPIPFNCALKLPSVIAGFCVEAEVSSFIGNSKAGICGASMKYCRILECLMPYSHFPKKQSEINDCLIYNKSQEARLRSKITVRIICVTPSKIISSAHWYLLNWSLIPKVPLKLGEILSDYKVEYIDNLDLIHLSGSDCRINLGLELFKQHADKKAKLNFRIGEKLPKCRALTTNMLEFGGTVATEPLILELPYITINDLHIGQLVTGKVKVIKEKYIIVELNRFLRCLLLREHATDSPLTFVPSNIKIDSEITCRVWNIDKQKNSIYLTAKSRLLKEENVKVKISSFEIHKHVWGVLANKTSKHMKISFYGNFNAYIANDSDIDAEYQIGSLVKCYIQDVNYINPSITISLSKTDENVFHCLDPTAMKIVKHFVNYATDNPAITIERLLTAIKKLSEVLPVLSELEKEFSNASDKEFLDTSKNSWHQFVLEKKDLTTSLKPGYNCKLLFPIWKCEKGVLGIFCHTENMESPNHSIFRKCYLNPVKIEKESSKKRKTNDQKQGLVNAEDCSNTSLESLMFINDVKKDLFIGLVPLDFYAYDLDCTNFILLTPTSFQLEKFYSFRNIPVLTNKMEILHMKTTKEFIESSEKFLECHPGSTKKAYILAADDDKMHLSVGDWNIRGIIFNSQMNLKNKTPTVGSVINVCLKRIFSSNHNAIYFTAETRNVKAPYRTDATISESPNEDSLYDNAYKLLKQYASDLDVPVPTKLTDIQIGKKYLGIVLNVSKNGVFILVGNKLKVRVLYNALPQAPVTPDLLEALYPTHSRVSCVRIVSITSAKPLRIEASLLPY